MDSTIYFFSNLSDLANFFQSSRLKIKKKKMVEVNPIQDGRVYLYNGKVSFGCPLFFHNTLLAYVRLFVGDSLYAMTGATLLKPNITATKMSAQIPSVFLVICIITYLD